MKPFDYEADRKFMQDTLVIVMSIILICAAIGWLFWKSVMVP